MRLGIAGGSGSGKSTIAKNILTGLGLDPTENSLSTDFYLVPLWEVQEALKKVFTPLNKNFLLLFNQLVVQDHFARYNDTLLCEHLGSIKPGSPTTVRAKALPHAEEKTITPSSRLFITEGLFALHRRVKSFNDFNFFIEITKPEQEQRIRNRFITKERKKPPEAVLKEKLNKIWISHTTNIGPTASNGDFLIQNKQSDSDRTTQCITEVITTLESAREELKRKKLIG
jgi:uridine kinase